MPLVPVSGPEPDPLDRLARRLKDKQAADLAYRCALYEAVQATGSVRQVEETAGLSRPTIHKLVKQLRATWQENGVIPHEDDRWYPVEVGDFEESSDAGISLGTFSAWLAYWEAEDAEAALVEWISTLPLVDQDKTYRAIHRHFEDAAYQEAVEIDWVYGPEFDGNKQPHYPHDVVGWEAVVEAGLPEQMTIPWHGQPDWMLERNWTDLHRDLGTDDKPVPPIPGPHQTKQ